MSEKYIKEFITEMTKMLLPMQTLSDGSEKAWLLPLQ